MKKNRFALPILTFGLIASSFIACDKDFATLESDVINSDVATNFDILSEQHDIIAYTKALSPVQSNGLSLSTLGLYDDSYGRTTSSFVSQLIPNSYDPDFGDQTVIDSVVLHMPYFSKITDFDDNGNAIYTIDSILPKGNSYAPLRLSIFENDYFIRNFDPYAEFDENQAYFSNKTAASSAAPTVLEMFGNALVGQELVFIDSPQTSYWNSNNNIIDISNDVFVLEEDDDGDDATPKVESEREIPGIRIKLDPVFWKNKIIDKEGDAVLSNQNNFVNYFRGLYFKAEAVNDNGSFLILETSKAKVTIYYSKLTASTSDDENETDTATYVLNFGSNKINFFDNNYTLPLNSGNPETGDSKIYLKGGEGAVAGIKLFNGEDLDDAPEPNTFETFKDDFVVTDDDGKFVSSKRLVNEANLVFYVDRNQLDMLGEDPDNEPKRIYLYDMANKTPLIDYYLDATNSTVPSNSKLSHLGILQREDDSEKGIKYKLKITEHINNLLLRDSTNVELGLAVSLSVNMEDTNLALTQQKVQGTEEYTVPISSVLTPRGTILHGNNSEDETKRVYLEIYYTEPN